MKSLTPISAMSVLTMLNLSACATQVPPVSVTRFHNAIAPAAASGEAPVPRGTVAILPAPVPPVLPDDRPAAVSGLEWDTYRAALAQELQRAGYTPVAQTSEAAQIATLTVERAAREAAARRSPVSVGVGGSTGSYGSGVGIGIGINLGGKPRRMDVVTLSVRIARADDGQSLWEGRAESAIPQASPAAQPGLAAAKLAAALFRDFPGESGRTITVP